MFGVVRRDDPQVSLSVNHVSVFFLSGFEKQTRVVCIPRVMLWRQLFALTVQLFAFFFFFKTDDFNCHFQFDLWDCYDPDTDHPQATARFFLEQQQLASIQKETRACKTE